MIKLIDIIKEIKINKKQIILKKLGPNFYRIKYPNIDSEETQVYKQAGSLFSFNFSHRWDALKFLNYCSSQGIPVKVEGLNGSKGIYVDRDYIEIQEPVDEKIEKI